MGAHIFISYERDDTAFAERLKDSLESKGLSTWMDIASMSGGEKWTQAIERAIEAADSVLVVVSRASNKSTWVRREVLYAQQMDKKVVPVLAERVSLPTILIDLNAISLHSKSDANLDKLVVALRSGSSGPKGPYARSTTQARPPAGSSAHDGKRVSILLWIVAGGACPSGNRAWIYALEAP